MPQPRREHFGQIATGITIFLAALVAHIKIDDSANQPAEARIWMHVRVGEEQPVRLDLATDEKVITVPLGATLALSAERSIQSAATPSGLSFYWRVGKLPCSTTVMGATEEICKDVVYNKLRSWEWSPSEAGFYAITLTVNNATTCYLFGSCSASHSDTFLIETRNNQIPLVSIDHQGIIELDVEELIRIQDIYTFNDISHTFEWRLDGRVVSRNRDYLLSRNQIETRDEADDGANAVLELLVRDKWGQRSEIVERKIRLKPKPRVTVSSEPTPETSPGRTSEDTQDEQAQPSEIRQSQSSETRTISGTVNSMLQSYANLQAINAVWRVSPLGDGSPGRVGSPGAPGANGRGEGGHAMPGGDGLPGTQGEQGATADSVNLDIADFSGSLRIDASGNRGGIGGNGGNGGPGGDGARGAPSRSGTFDCRAGPGRGGRGGAGGNGAAGGAGGNGGDAGAVNVSFVSIEPGSSIVILSEGGPGGEPAPGGRGGIGGAGGPEGATSRNCRSAGRTGDAGSPGQDGSRGTPGQIGRPGKITLRVGEMTYVSTSGRLDYPITAAP